MRRPLPVHALWEPDHDRLPQAHRLPGDPVRPLFVKEVIARLREAGEIAFDGLVYLDRIADRWIRIAEENLAKGQRR